MAESEAENGALTPAGLAASRERVGRFECPPVPLTRSSTAAGRLMVVRPWSLDHSAP